MIAEICKKEKCTGCFACMNICPHDAISCGTDEMNKTIPIVSSDKCTECGFCAKICPANHPVQKNYPLKCFAAWSKDEQERKYCSSGGIATELSKAVIAEGGVVYGAAFDEALKLNHIEVKKIEEVERLKGSKYVQSYTGLMLRKVKENLTAGKKVLFIGTPCQVAGVRAYLRKDYENLILVDLICHGTPPIAYLKEYVKAIDPEGKATNLTFRGKNNFCLTLYEKEEVLYSKRSKRDYYFSAFLNGLIYRDNCYACEYARAERGSDITIGDFWKLNRATLKSHYMGRISAVLVNTETGIRVWENFQDRFEFEERKAEEAIQGNDQLRRPSDVHEDRKIFEELYLKGDFASAVKTPNMKKAIMMSRIDDSLPYRAVKKLKKIFGR